jgi:predicted transcriptional regulator
MKYTTYCRLLAFLQNVDKWGEMMQDNYPLMMEDLLKQKTSMTIVFTENMTRASIHHWHSLLTPQISYRNVDLLMMYNVTSTFLCQKYVNC